MAFQLPDLPYPKNALEPHIDAQTMEVHHDKHHAGYTSKLNDALEGTGNENASIEEILKNVSKHGDAIRNNGGGYYNHSLFWTVMSPNGGGEPSGDLANAINDAFGSFENFKEEFSNAAKSRFGSGWAWLLIRDGKLQVSSTPNQDNPLMDIAEVKGTPILGLDVWEHAYYLKYQNRRPDYVSAFFNVINWDEVSKRYEAAKYGFV
ncbi:MAG: superoxide dismutase [Owenweeksia sp.]|nr:superoxide dismutase [Owenweeksia sp.]